MKTFKTFNKEKDLKDFEEDIAATPEKETDTSLEKEENNNEEKE